MSERHVALFRNGRNQAIRIPREFELDATRAIIRQQGQCLIIEPVLNDNRLLNLLASWQPLTDDLSDIPDPAPMPQDIF